MTGRLRGWIGRHRGLAAVTVLVAVAGAVFVVVWFEPHKLFIDDLVDEAVPGLGMAATSPGPSATAGASPDASPARTPDAPREPLTLSRGDFRPLEHDVEGRAVVIETGDGRRYLRLEDLNVSNGPDLFVYLSVLGDDQGWHDAGGAEFLDLGPLKGNVGSSNYEIPAGTDLSRFRSAVIWCRRFTVGFAVAPVRVR